MGRTISTLKLMALMDPNEIAQQSVNNLAGLFVLTAIPTVSFALWGDYFERYFDSKVSEEPDLDRTAELRRVRAAGVWVTICQMTVFFTSTPIRREDPLFAYPLFLAAVLIQLGVQRGLETKIRDSIKILGKELGKAFGNSKKLEQALAPDQSLFWQAIRTFFWSLAAGMLYMAAISVSVFFFALLGVGTHAPELARLGLVLIGMGVGVIGGLGLNFALAAFFVRKMMSAQALPEGALQKEIQGIFNQSLTPQPDIWVINTPGFSFGSAMIAGFPKGKKPFRPGLFLTEELINNLTPLETEAVVLHEISHVKLQHLKKRFLFSCGLILCGSLFTGMAIMLSRGMGYPPQVQSTLGCIALIASFGSALMLLARQVKFQEITADVHSVEKLGAKIEHLASALRKLDKLAGNIGAPNDMGSRALSLGHPSTEFRIRLLEKYFFLKSQKQNAAQAASSVEKSAQDDDSSKAA